MTIEELIHHVQPGTEITVANGAFSCAGRATVTLEGGDRRHWIFDSDGGMLSVAPEDEEIIAFSSVQEEMEPQGELVIFGNKEYEFSYEDIGTMTESEGEVNSEVEDQLTIADYEAEDGEIVRLVTNQNTGGQLAYVGKTVVEEDIQSA